MRYVALTIMALLLCVGTANAQAMKETKTAPVAAAPAAASTFTLTAEEAATIVEGIKALNGAKAQVDNINLQLENFELKLKVKYKVPEDYVLSTVGEGKDQHIAFVPPPPQPK